MTTLGNSVDSLELFVRQVDALEVGLHTRRVTTLGQHDVATAQTPGDQHLGQSVTTLGRNVVQSLVLVDTLTSSRDLVLRAQRRVGSGHDTLAEAVLNQFVVGEEGVDLDLVDMRRDLGELQELLHARDGPVRNTNGLGLSALVDFLHCSPGRLGVLGEVVEDNVLHIVGSGRAGKHMQSWDRTYLAIRANLRLLLGLLLGSNGPVKKEEVNVVELQAIQGVLDRPFDILGAVQVVPDLGADEDVFTLNRGVFLEEIPNGLANLALVEIEPGAVQVPVTSAQGMEGGLVGLTHGALTGEGTETDTRDGDTVAKLEGLAGRHGG